MNYVSETDNNLSPVEYIFVIINACRLATQLDGPGVESGRGGIFRTRPDQPRCPPSLLRRG